jgi:hypothetical protein
MKTWPMDAPFAKTSGALFNMCNRFLPGDSRGTGTTACPRRADSVTHEWCHSLVQRRDRHRAVATGIKPTSELVRECLLPTGFLPVEILATACRYRLLAAAGLP